MVRLIVKGIKGCLILGLMGLLVLLAINIYIYQEASEYVYSDSAELPKTKAALILGASVHGRDLSLILEDRVKAGIDLYEAGLVDKLILSGDHGSVDYDEVNSMRLYILEHSSVDEADIFMDHAGFDTYDSMYRAQAIFGVDDLIIVTQNFHISRAVFIARQLGINAYGYAVDDSRFKLSLLAKWQVREVFSRVKALLDVEFEVGPTFLGRIYDINGDGRETWDINE